MIEVLENSELVVSLGLADLCLAAVTAWNCNEESRYIHMRIS